MLVSSEQYKTHNIQFQNIDIISFANSINTKFDLVFSNATLHWIPDHEKLFKLFEKIINPERGQIAIQVPINYNHISQTVIPDILKRNEYKKYLSSLYQNPTQSPEYYSKLLHDLGYHDQKIRVIVYPHLLKSASEMAEWTKGSTLSFYRSIMPLDVFNKFYEDYKIELVSRVNDSSPFLFTFNRLFIWGSKKYE